MRSRFHFRDEQLRRQFAEALSGDRPLHAGPFLELLPAFETTRTIRELAEAGVLHRRLLDLRSEAADLDRPLYRHQEEALQKIQAGRNVVVATGTGSGKTETYLLPIVSHLFETLNGRSRKPAVRALLVYPMNALANDQLRRIRQLLEHEPSLTFGRYTGETPKRAKDGEARFRQMWPHEPVLKNELKSREEMWASPPDILITNFAMLEYLLVRPQEAMFFVPGGIETLKFLVFDEVHTYDGAKGCEISMLLRRLRQRIGATTRGRLRCIGTSATLGGGHDFPDVAKYAEQLFDEPFEWGDRAERQDVIRAYREPYQRPTQTWQPQPEVYETLSRILADGPANAATFEKVCREAGFPRDAVTEAAALFKEGTVAASGSSAPIATDEGEDWGWEPQRHRGTCPAVHNAGCVQCAVSPARRR